MKQKGFTLIEMMVVVAIIGIVGNYALPNYSNMIVAKQMQEGLKLADFYKLQIVEYYRLNGRFPANNEALGIPPANKVIGNYVTALSIDNGVINVTYGNYVNKAVEKKIISIAPLMVTGSPKSPIGWTCGYRKPPTGMERVGVNNSSALVSMVPMECRN